MKISKILTFFLIFFISINVYAIDACTESEMTRLRELANNVEFKTSYETYDEDENGRAFREYYIEIVNFDDDLRVGYNSFDTNEEVLLRSNQKIEELFTSGQTLKFKIYAYTTNYCTEKLLKTVTIKLPYYNYYYHLNKDKCEQNPDFKYCKEDLDTSNLTVEEIDKLYDEYVKEKQSSNTIDSSNNKKWYIIGGIGGFVVLSIVVVIIVYKRNKNRENDI